MAAKRMFETQESAAASLRANEKTFRTWKQKADWPFGTTGPWDVRAIAAWRHVILGVEHDPEGPEPDSKAFEAAMQTAGLSLPESGDPMPTAIGEANLRYRLAQIRKLELDHDIRAGLYILRTASDTVYQRMMGLVRAKIEQWAQGMPEMFRDSTREQIAKLATARYDRICRELEAVERVNLLSEPAKCDKPTDAKKSKAASKRHGRKR